MAMNLLKQFLSKDAGHVVQFIKYGIAGGLATLTQIVVFFALGWRLLPCLTDDDIMVKLLGIAPSAIGAGDSRALNAAIANALAFILANGVAYLLNVLFVFKAGKHHWLVEILLFYAVSGIAMVIGTALQTLLIARYGIMTTFAFSAYMVSALLINYAMRKFFIFHG
jgi:putative flippase GtrA